MTQPAAPGTAPATEAVIRERLDTALHDWWNDEHPNGSRHSCRPVPSEDEFLAQLALRGLTIELARLSPPAPPSEEPELPDVV
jgi:hypothetical protein